ncbi:MAG TPA: tetratricopeptide repeat protein, partial [Gaiellaceae bacterium]|nr:tetratricopeptide repeat protein [Gaiellaceae bacterium]
GRFRTLENIRAYARKKLQESGMEDRFMRKHASHFANQAAEADARLRANDETALAFFEEEHDNLRLALAFLERADGEAFLQLAASCSWYWFVRGHMSEGRSWLTRALTAAGCEAQPALRAVALMRIGSIAEQQGDLDVAEQALDECVNVRRSLGDTAGTAAGLCNLGNVFRARNNLLRAKEIYAEVLAIGRAIDSDEDCASALCNLGVVAAIEEDYDTARAFLIESLRLAKKLNIKYGQAIVEGALGAVASDTGDLVSACSYLWSSFEIAREMDSPEGVLSQLEELAFVAARLRRFDVGVYVFAAAAALRDTHGIDVREQAARREKILRSLSESLDRETFKREYEAGLAATSDEIHDRSWQEIVLAAGQRDQP